MRNTRCRKIEGFLEILASTTKSGENEEYKVQENRRVFRNIVWGTKGLGGVINSNWLLLRRRSNIGGFSPSSHTSSSPLASPVPSSSSALTSCSSPALHSPLPEPPPPAPVNILMKPLESMKLKVPKKHKRSKEKKLKHFVSPKRLKIMYRNLYGRVIQFAKNLPKPTVK